VLTVIINRYQGRDNSITWLVCSESGESDISFFSVEYQISDKSMGPLRASKTLRAFCNKLE
jgi:hypothetical protein